MTDELWLPCPEYEGRYEVSSLGRIRSLPREELAASGVRRKVRGGILNPMLSPDGYPRVSLRKDGKLRTMTLHRLICRAFHGEQPNPIHKEVAHLDGVRTNARADNLKWVGKFQNHSHRREHGTLPKGERHPQAKLTEQAVRDILSSALTARALAERYGVSRDTVADIRRGRRWPHIQRVSTFAGAWA